MTTPTHSPQSACPEFSWYYAGFWRVVFFIALAGCGGFMLTAIVVISFALYTGTSLDGLNLFIAWPLPVVAALLWLVHRIVDDGKLLLCTEARLTLSSDRTGLLYDIPVERIKEITVQDNTLSLRALPIRPNKLIVVTAEREYTMNMWGDFVWNFAKLQSHVRSLDAFLQESAKKRRR
ncbi:hypothetical protein MA04_01269 [Alcanivorax balearicus MACL04]|uniref:PH domain-containing protein n=1 Tax=Alloalcanivorax balearicus MACL04 TaxID=1177182 RepID=A0ABT2QWR3_9GAMM|nr:hypothetical protein [Alloalcanivorax balearicus]MCU5781969.1 hypothetical protein [Alloalcanivorax balearicus MACL04]